MPGTLTAKVLLAKRHKISAASACSAVSLPFFSVVIERIAYQTVEVSQSNPACSAVSLSILRSSVPR